MRMFVAVALIAMALTAALAACASAPAPAPAEKAAAPAAPSAAKPAAEPAKPAAPAAQPAAPAKPAAPAQPAAAGKRQLTPGFSVEPALLEAAKKEGRVVWWGAFPEQHVRTIAARFEELTGIKVETTRLSAGPQFTRLTKEREAKLYTVDVIHHGGMGLWLIYKQKKFLTPYTPDETRKYAAEFRDPEGQFFANHLWVMPIGYNTKVITGADMPKRFADLSDPKYKAKVATAHPKHSGTANELVVMLTERAGLGWDYYERLKRNDLFIVRSQLELNPVTVSGERPIALGASDSAFLEDKANGKPLDVIYPEEGTPVSPVNTAVVANAPHPNAAKLFQDWLHSPTVHSMATTWWYLVPHPEATYPAGRKRLSEIKTITLSLDEVEKKTMPTNERFSELFGG